MFLKVVRNGIIRSVNVSNIVDHGYTPDGTFRVKDVTGSWLEFDELVADYNDLEKLNEAIIKQGRELREKARE